MSNIEHQTAIHAPRGAVTLAREEALLFETSVEDRIGFELPPLDVPDREVNDLIPAALTRPDIAGMPELSEVDVVRHYTRLSQWNYSIDTGMYPLGSCTMKYNPRINEVVAALPGFTCSHPLQPARQVQGNLRIMYELGRYLAAISGMDEISLQPAAGAQGELTGMMVIKAYHEHNGHHDRDLVLIPNTAHGTNPASSALCGYRTVELHTDARGNLDLESLKQHLSDKVAALMVTNPNTIGLFEEGISEAIRLVHSCGGMVYCDGANLNALMGKTRPGDWGADVLHFNLHKTFSTPHGGGGPGAGPIGVKSHLAPFLPVPQVVRTDAGYDLAFDRPHSIGKVMGFFGNFGVMIKAFAYIRTMGPDGLRLASETAVLNANYVKESLRADFNLPYDRTCKHEVVFNDEKQSDCGAVTLDIAKRLMDYGFHPPTIYFPLIVHGALMIEPTETESLDTLDEFIAAMKAIAAEAKQNCALLHEAPVRTFRARLDETTAARKPILRWRPSP
ncbi:aminomethyl-transferring glycine dehydrogenase subunit GcvPB [bacterium]|nr:aminomethyl-transferring glycine dehydrogenase subunit GcvPB [candidate division CSSED10-310 bacterium]